uniref:Uncharacterized protein n=1 Tax=Arundo donax TaxID=35708 RepID=A0A0A9FJA2_ARUDO
MKKDCQLDFFGQNSYGFCISKLKLSVISFKMPESLALCRKDIIKYAVFIELGCYNNSWEMLMLMSVGMC